MNILDHENRVHYIRVMKNITFSADERLIEFARDEAKNRKTTLNQLFRDWLEDLAARDERRSKATAAYEKLATQITSIPKLTRDEMNER
jgi:FMN phosphatase YigB (HAD superfamily)